MAQALKLLSGPQKFAAVEAEPSFFSTNGQDTFMAPSSYTANRHAWVHIFPEACCHQSPNSTLRYFKWGVSRLILESDPAPDFIPMFVHGTQLIMPEERGWPRWAPRIGNRIRVAIGEPADVDKLFGKQRAAWKRLVDKGDPELLRNGQEAIRLRVEVAKMVRDEISKLRESMGLVPEKDETAALAETWAKEPDKRKFKSPVDGSLINRH